MTFVETVNQGRPALSHYFRAIDHVETCVGSLHRTLLHLNAINATETGRGGDLHSVDEWVETPPI